MIEGDWLRYGNLAKWDSLLSLVMNEAHRECYAKNFDDVIKTRINMRLGEKFVLLLDGTITWLITKGTDCLGPLLNELPKVFPVTDFSTHLLLIILAVAEFIKVTKAGAKRSS